MSAIICEDHHHTYTVFDATTSTALGTFASLLDASSWCYRRKIAWRLDLESMIPFTGMDTEVTTPPSHT
ncbi:MAG TPA: hypothetical protein VIH45_10635 [Desulfuromonadaceae bacterium]